MKPNEDFYLAKPKAGRGQGVLVLHAWWGLNPFFKRFCDRLARAGFVALAPDLFEGQVAATIDQAKRLRSKPKREPTYKTILRGVDFLAQHESVIGNQIGVVGFSMGGHWAFWLASRPRLPIGATVAFYGVRAGDFTHSASAFQCHFAETDTWVSRAAIKKLEKTLNAAGKELEMFTYPGTTHWFFERDRLDAYDAKAAGLAWRRTIDFLNQHLESKGAK